MSDDWVNAKTLQVIGEYSMMHDLVTLDGVAYVCNERYKPYYEENAARLERERIIALLETEMCEAYGENCDNNPHCTARNRVIALIKGENND